MTDMPTLTGATVRDEHGEKLGSVSTVYFDDRLEKPIWAAVKLSGLHRKHHLIPLRGSYRSADNDLVVPYDKTAISSSPVDDTGVSPTSSEAQALDEHFDVEHVQPMGTDTVQ
jgi:hypothetical protein